jgi:hypothetical protein
MLAVFQHAHGSRGALIALGLKHFSDWYRVLPQASVGIFLEKMPIARLCVTLQKSEK